MLISVYIVLKKFTMSMDVRAGDDGTQVIS
jgi:hypothetical protein